MQRAHGILRVGKALCPHGNIGIKLLTSVMRGEDEQQKLLKDTTASSKADEGCGGGASAMAREAEIEDDGNE